MNYTDRERDLIIADSLKELSYKQKKLFLASLSENNTEREKYAAALIKNCGEGVYNKVKGRFDNENYRKKTFENLDKRRIKCVTYKSADYPAELKEIPAPPLVLYARGNTKLLTSVKFGVVGSRKTTPAAFEECKKICSSLAEKLTVVTGIADGADRAAATGALPSGNVICVMPCGHDGGGTHTAIVKEFEKVGLTVSEFPPQTSAQRFTFFLRNRIIAGLCKGVLVVSAAEKSGALNTASYAADYSRDVFAIPYCPGIPSGVGCNKLIKGGAYLCDCAEDILTVLGFACGDKKESIILDGDESAVIELLREKGELHAEKIAAAIGKKPYEVSAICASLEIKGLLVKTGGNKYSAV